MVAIRLVVSDGANLLFLHSLQMCVTLFYILHEHNDKRDNKKTDMKLVIVESPRRKAKLPTGQARKGTATI